MATGCNAKENIFKLSYLMLQKKFPCWKLRRACAQCPIAGDATVWDIVKEL
jgi:hypothetical protein